MCQNCNTSLISSSLPGSYVHTVSAFDLDGDDISYYISPDSLNADNFRVENDTGIVRVGNGAILDREVRCWDMALVTAPLAYNFSIKLPLQVLTPNNQQLTLIVRATDGIDHAVADPSFTLYILLLDENDNSPIITNLPRTVSFPEVSG